MAGTQQLRGAAGAQLFAIACVLLAGRNISASDTLEGPRRRLLADSNIVVMDNTAQQVGGFKTWFATPGDAVYAEFTTPAAGENKVAAVAVTLDRSGAAQPYTIGVTLSILRWNIATPPSGGGLISVVSSRTETITFNLGTTLVTFPFPDSPTLLPATSYAIRLTTLVPPTTGERIWWKISTGSFTKAEGWLPATRPPVRPRWTGHFGT